MEKSHSELEVTDDGEGDDVYKCDLIDEKWFVEDDLFAPRGAVAARERNVRDVFARFRRRILKSGQLHPKVI